MTAKVIQFVPRSSIDRRPMLEQMAHEVLEQVTEPVLYESSVGYVDLMQPPTPEQLRAIAEGKEPA